MSIAWKDLDEPLNCFTVRNAKMMDLRKRTEVQQYTTNTKIVVVQKCVLPEGTFYRTKSAKENGLDWAFKASAFGLPDEKAPLAHCAMFNSTIKMEKPRPRKYSSAKKQIVAKKGASSENGETKPHMKWIKRFFGRKNG